MRCRLHAARPGGREGRRTTLRQNPAVDVEKSITEMGVGEALVSFLDEKGRPHPVERAFVIPPRSRIGPITPDERRKVIAASLVAGHYEKAVDRESAYELLGARAGARAQAGGAAAGEAQGGMTASSASWGCRGDAKGRTRESPMGGGQSAARAIGSEVGDASSAACGSILGGRR
jgi:hypothetical protein